MVEQTIEDDGIGVDLATYEKEQDERLEDSFVDLETYQKHQEERQEIGWGETIGDWFTQAGRGVLKAFTWPADVLKLAMIGEGLSDIEDLENAFERAGKPFDRDAYVQAVLNQSHYIPTQDLLEEGFEHLTGLSLQPKTEGGKRIKQGAELLSFARGGPLSRLKQAATGVGTTEALKKAGVGEDKAQVLGDIASLSPSSLEKVVKSVPKSAEKLSKTAQKFALPFKEFMTRERAPFLKGKLFKRAEENLRDSFNVSAKQALSDIVTEKIPIKKLRERGVNLDALAEHAYDVTEQMAKGRTNVFDTSNAVANIDKEIGRLRNLAPSPSDAQKAAIELLERERDILKVAKPNAEQIINQHKNYNADMKAIYRKPEFSGKEEQLRKTYEFLKDEAVDLMEKQGSPDVANAFKAANKIYHEKSKLLQTESLLERAFNGETYSPNKLDKLLRSKQGNLLRRNLGKEAVEDLEEIAKFGKSAEEKMGKFLDIGSSSVSNEVKAWGKLAPFVLLPSALKGAAVAFATPLAKHVQGKLLTREATRKAYKLTLKHASEGAFNLMKKDFAQLEKAIGREWGSVDDFMDDSMQQLEVYDSE